MILWLLSRELLEQAAAAAMVAVSAGQYQDFTILEDINLNEIAKTAQRWHHLTKNYK